MKRYALLAATAVVGGAVAFQGSVNLQATTPGSPQTGHLNITGTARAGVMVGYSTTPTGIAFGGDFRSASTSGRGVLGNASATTGATYGGLFQSFSNAGRGVAGIAQNATGNTYGGFFSSLSVAGYGVYGQATATTGTTYGVYGLTNSPAGTGVYGLASSSSGGAGGVFRSNGEQGNGVVGIATSTIGDNAGVYGVSDSAEGYGVRGRATHPSGYAVFAEGNLFATGIISGNGSGLTSLNASNISTGVLDSARLPVPLLLTGLSPTSILRVENTSVDWYSSAILGVSSGATGPKYGVHGVALNSLGTGVYGEGGGAGVEGISTGGFGVYGLGYYGVRAQGTLVGILAQSSATFGEAYGGQFSATSPGTGAAGVFARSSATTGTTYGVWGQSDSTAGTGLGGYNLSATGTTYGTYGYTTSGTGWAVYAGGKFGASGTKSFRIDHPLDPENKYLLHYSTESPTPQNFYVGNVVTDANGYAWVELPDYFDEINKNFKYQLTVVDGPNSSENDFVMVKVRQEIKDGRFQIRTSAPNTKVSWRVDADRNDLYVRNRPPKDVEDKVGHEKGKYQHPEFYGLGPERGMNYQAERAKKPIKPKK
ncbi:MAG: hypothetical protein ABL962_01905 [Fimbriimonadaceae bacterium]